MAQSSMAFRAAIAVALMASFYVLAIGVASFLFLVPWLQSELLGRVFLQLSLASVIAGCVILWSILPRPDRFDPPGLRLEASSQPDLFREIDAVARATGQAAPEEVYLVLDVNAWVAQRGGVMGFGSRPVMGLGLPLLQVLSVAQLRAVLAHEFGHFHGGDTRLAPWVYKTRAAIGRTLAALAEQRALLVHILFDLYGNFFLRVTHAVSRQQELNADVIAVRVQGASVFADALKMTHAATFAFATYWKTEVVPLLQAGVLPPLADGFGRYVAASGVSEEIKRTIELEIREGQNDPYDTHPPLRERLDVLSSADDAAPPGPAAMSLVHGLPELERGLLRFARVHVDKMRAVAWDDVAEQVLRPLYRSKTEAAVRVFAEFSVERLPEVADRVRGMPGADWHLGAALADTLLRGGWAIHAGPGCPVRLTCGQRCIEPFVETQALVRRRTSPEVWRERCATWGVGGLVLAEPYSS